MSTLESKNSSAALYRKYIHKSDLLLLLIHLAMKYSMKHCSFIPNMTKKNAYYHNAETFVNLHELSKPISKYQEIAKAEFISLSKGYPLSYRIDQALMRIVRYIFFHNEG